MERSFWKAGQVKETQVRNAYGLLRRIFNISLLLWWPAAGATATLAAQSPLIVAFGDSLSAGYQLPPADSFPAQLQAALRADGIAATVHNAGVSGDTTSQGKARLDWVMKGLKAKPDLVILELGANDSLRGIDPKITRANLDAMLADFKKRGVSVLIAGMLAPPNLGNDYGKAYNSIFPDLAKKYTVPLYPFFMDGVALNDKLKLADAMHPNKQGVAVIVQRILPTVKMALQPKSRRK
jgi:acyl-CoA thioesterase I